MAGVFDGPAQIGAFGIATLNVRGSNSSKKQCESLRVLEKHSCDIVTLEETKVSDNYGLLPPNRPWMDS